MSLILMVDDDQDFLEASKNVLESEGHNVIMANNVKGCEDALKSQEPDVIFLDIMMEQPDDGIALANKLKKNGMKSPIVMLSGVSKVTGYKYGKCDEVLPCSSFLEKPITPKALIDKVNEILKG